MLEKEISSLHTGFISSGMGGETWFLAVLGTYIILVLNSESQLFFY